MIARFHGSLSWISRDAWLITAARGTRTFSQSLISVIMALYLDELGFSVVQIGAVLTVGVAGVSFFAFVVGLVSVRVGRRRLLIIFSLLAAASGIGMYFADTFIPLMVIAFVGSLSGGGSAGESPAQPLEVASIADTASQERRTDLFAFYGIVARVGTFLGALAAGLPVLFQDAFGLSVVSSFAVMFLGFAICQFAGAALYALASPAVEGVTTGAAMAEPVEAGVAAENIHADRAVQLGHIHQLHGDPELGGLLVLHEIRADSGSTGNCFRIVTSFDGNLPVGSSEAGEQVRTAEHDGIHTHPVEPVHACSSLRSHRRRWR